VKRLLALVGMTVGGWLGWAIGAWFSLFAAFVVGMIGSAAGLYLVNRYLFDWIP
jgi:hypothetical protein